MTVPTRSAAEQSLCDQRVAFVGRLVGMTRREASRIVREHGGSLVADESDTATLIVIGDNQPDLASAVENDKAADRRFLDEVAAGRAQLLHESELWQRVGLVGDDHADGHGVQRLYTPAMLADVLKVPVAAIRRWHRRGALVACRSVRRLPYFDFTEVAVARHLAALFTAGCSLHVIDRKLAELNRSMPEVERPLCDPSIVVSGRCLYRRRGDDLAEPGGQLLIDFDKPLESDEEDQSFSMSVAAAPADDDLTGADAQLTTLDQMREEAIQWEDQGELERAAETYRTILVAGGPVAEVHFALANLLYRMDDLSAARERFYSAIEIDEEYVEARANLGCVLAENSELDLAVAAFQGALAFHPDYADVHFHLASVLDRLELGSEAESHWRIFLTLSPESPWAETAKARLGAARSQPLVVSE